MMQRRSVHRTEEEAAVGLADVVSFHLEQRLRELGAEVVLAPKFTSNAVRDGYLVTGRNLQSSEDWAAQIVAALEERQA